MLTLALFIASASANPGIHQPESQGSKKALTLHIEQSIAATPEQVWAVLGHDYTGIDAWASLVETSRDTTDEEVPADFVVAPGAPVPGRVVTTGFGEVNEVLVGWSDAHQTFTFRAAGLPPIIAYSQNTTQVHADGAHSLVSFDIHMVPKGPAKLMKGALRKRMTKGLERTLVELAHFVETGEPAPTKVAAAGH